MRRDPKEFITLGFMKCTFSLTQGEINSLVFLYFLVKKNVICGPSNLFFSIEILQTTCGNYSGNLDIKTEFILGTKYLKKLTVQGG